MSENTNKKRYLFIWLKVFLVLFFIFPLLFAVGYYVFEKKFENRIYPGIHAGSIELGGKTTTESVEMLNKKLDIINQDGIIFYYDYYQATLFPLISSAAGDMAYQLIDVDVETTVNKAFDLGRNQSFMQNLKFKINSWINKSHTNILGNINNDEINKFLFDNFSRFETPPMDAQLEFIPKTYTDSEKFIVNEEKYGQVLDYSVAIEKLFHNINSFNNTPIELSASVKSPNIYKKDCTNVDAKAKKIYSLAPLTLSYDGKKAIISKEDFSNWLTIKSRTDNSESIYIGIDYLAAENYLTENISEKVDIDPIEARFEMVDNKVSEFQVSKNGLKLNTLESTKAIEKELLENDNNAIELITEIIQSEITASKLDELGIKEVLGTGSSKHTGSPSNRRHNIRTGAGAINGLLIKPDEEFSLIKALGNIDKEGGYLTELVIKDNKTIPEYGGGLCQIGTTLFRTVYESGLPITLRRNHSYRVSYYEPAGTDATIYDPWPDFRFLNDTGNHILIQTHVDDENNNVWFEFWGTNDGRVATSTYPVIYNIVRPGPTKIIETLDLEPGVKKCTEHAHNGADAYFDYKVTYPNGDIKEERFKSHYVPWREVCLLGVEKLSSEENNTASSTPETIQ